MSRIKEAVMGGRLNWKRAKPIGPTESSFGSDVAMKDGSRTPEIRPDSLARRAADAEDQWRRTMSESQRAKYDHAEKPKANRIPRKAKFTGRRAKANRLGKQHK